jgi:Sec-independent protein translocase protein TatA
MDFLGVGPLELVFILIIALIIFGPNDIVRTGKSLGRFLRKVVTSDGWKAFQQASKGMRDLPTTLIREAGLEEEDLRELTGVKDFEQATRGIDNQFSTWTTPPHRRPENPADPEEMSLPVISTPPKMEPPSSEQENQTTPEELPAPPPDSPFSHTIDDNN